MILVQRCLKLIQSIPYNAINIQLYNRHITKLSVQVCSTCERRYTQGAQQEPSDLIEIYNGALTKQMRRVKIFSLTTSGIGIMSQPVLYQQIMSSGGGISLTIFLGTFVGFFTFITPLLLHTITKKYVTQIHFNEKDDSYVASLMTIFLRKKELPFRSKDIEVVDVPGMFTSFHIKGLPVFVDARQFRDVNHYAKMMGYDKPIDFSLEETREKQ